MDGMDGEKHLVSVKSASIYRLPLRRSPLRRRVKLMTMTMMIMLMLMVMMTMMRQSVGALQGLMMTHGRTGPTMMMMMTMMMMVMLMVRR